MRVIVFALTMVVATWAQTEGPLKVKRPPLQPARTAKPPPPPPEKDPSPAEEERTPEPRKAPKAPNPCPEGYIPKPAPTSSDERPPKLRRGKPAEYERAEEEPASTGLECVWSEVEVSDEGSVLAHVSRPPGFDPFIERVRQEVFKFSDTLPNYICDQKVVRYEGNDRPLQWKRKDRLATEVLYVNGLESYQNTTRNGKKMKKDPEETGQWSTGEFGTIMMDVFATNTNAKFSYARDSEIGGVTAKVYDYRVALVGSHWKITYGGQQTIPAYTGSVWIDPETYRVMRIEMRARRLADDYPMQLVEMTVDYGPVTIAGNDYLLVVKAENLSCKRDSFRCYRNEIAFENYRQFTTESSVSTTESTITFEGEEPKKK